MLHLITCHGRIMPRLAELLFKFIIKSRISRIEKCKLTNVQLNKTVGEVLQATVLDPNEDILITSISFFKKLLGHLASAMGDMHVLIYQAC